MEKSDAPGVDTVRPWQSYHTVYTNAKAGMEGVDKEKVQRVVYEMSKGSKYFENEERKEAFIRQKIENMRARCEKLTARDLSHCKKVADKRIVELEATRDLSRIWLHVDMDAFYAAVETLSNPLLRDKPMAVGCMSMISTANYEARRFGVRAAMPGFIARRLCPELIFVPTDFKKYTYYSDLTRKVFQRYDLDFIAASLDEAYLDITKVCRERVLSSEEIAKELRSSVYEETGLTCSAGVAPNRLLAKVCSDINKPNGQFILSNDRAAVMTFISSLPIRKIGGIGKVTEHILMDAFGIKTCEEMLQKGGYLCALFSRSAADFFLSVGLGLGRTDTPQVRLRKSISNERTFTATEDKTLFYQKLADLAEMLSSDMQREGLYGRTLTLKLKTESFEVRTRAVTLPNYICSGADILKNASKLLKDELPVSLRLIGLRVSQFNEDKVGAPSDPTQRTLTRFVISGDTSKKNMDDQFSLDIDMNDHHFSNDIETEPNDSNCEFSNFVGDLEKFENSSSNLSAEADMVKNFDIVECIPIYNEGEVSSSGADCSTSGHYGRYYEDRLNTGTDKDGASSAKRGNILWVNDYECSVCKIELPPSFVQERQEHSDFHMAEKLQEEESGIQSTILVSRKRIVDKDQRATQKKHKRQKSTPKEGRHIPIDLFFVKSNQNF